MNRTTNNSNFWHSVARSAALAWLVGALAGAALAQSNAQRPPAGVRNSRGARSLTGSQLQMIRETLRQKSGFVELGFDAQGALLLGDRNRIQGGSATARALLAAAVDSYNLYELESYDHSPEVAFARIDETEDRLIGELGHRMTFYHVQLDFADFEHLAGPREARAAFDIGIALLHELVHGVLKLQDPQGELKQIGACDAHINQIRRELQLPERLYYHPNLAVVQTSMGRIVCASLEFAEQRAQALAKYRLSWQAGQVSPNARNVAQLQQGLARPSIR